MALDDARLRGIRARRAARTGVDGSLGLDALDIVAGPRVDFDPVPHVDKKRYVHRRAGLERRRFLRAGGRVAADPRNRFHDFQLDGDRDRDRNDLGAVEKDGHRLGLFQELHSVADDFPVDRDLVIGLLVHEHVTGPVLVEVLILLGVYEYRFDSLTYPQPRLDDLPRPETFELRPDERPPASRINDLELRHVP